MHNEFFSKFFPGAEPVMDGAFVQMVITTEEKVSWDRLKRMRLFQDLHKGGAGELTLQLALWMRARIPLALTADFDTYNAYALARVGDDGDALLSHMWPT